MLDKLNTEKANNKTQNLDEMSIKEVLNIMNEEDISVPIIVGKAIPNIEKVVELVIKSFKNDGRLIYIGAGTSGRLGILDAVECPPTFSTNYEQVIGIIAGGEKAFVKAVEGAEDSAELAVTELKAFNLTEKDTVIGLAASGRTPYVIGGLEYANSINASTAAIACNVDSEIGSIADVAIEVDTGAEILTGSTRLKAGTAQKLILNMISTASMIQIGKSYNNLMVDLNPSNEKLVERSKKIVMTATGTSYEEASRLLELTSGKPKLAIIMSEIGCDVSMANRLLNVGQGFVKKAIQIGKEEY
jgi:N-acetylmuramic acid 6-phosphate etherase